ncbi:MAG: helix-turn-helix transcriptional regulator [Proteobacteria bacterium]|nr:helix-turn-helix transcriptional regulator [Pseudomonadota bacterium]
MPTSYPVENGIVKIPVQDFKVLQERLEELENIAALDSALAQNEEAFPGDVVKRLLDGESPVKVFREHREMTQAVLAKKTGVTKTTISEIETGRKQGSVGTLKAIANALGLDIDDLV